MGCSILVLTLRDKLGDIPKVSQLSSGRILWQRSGLVTLQLCADFMWLIFTWIHTPGQNPTDLLLRPAVPTVTRFLVCCLWNEGVELCDLVPLGASFLKWCCPFPVGEWSEHTRLIRMWTSFEACFLCVIMRHWCYTLWSHYSVNQTDCMSVWLSETLHVSFIHAYVCVLIQWYTLMTRRQVSFQSR